jgi:hypothetical protein
VVRDVPWIHARRVGWGETEYNDEGEQAPLRWVCDRCGSFVLVELLNRETNQYETVPWAMRDAFIAEHKLCVSLSDFGGDPNIIEF